MLPSSGYSLPSGVALDSAGKLYITDTFNDAVKKYDPVTQQTTTLISSGLAVPHGVAVDGLGNLYIADNGNNAVEVWNPTTQQLTTLVSSGLNLNEGVAVDGSGNVYIADGNDQAIPSAQTKAQFNETGSGSCRDHRWVDVNRQSRAAGGMPTRSARITPASRPWRRVPHPVTLLPVRIPPCSAAGSF